MGFGGSRDCVHNPSHMLAKNQNVAFLVSLTFAVAASANLPVILFSLFWKRFNTTGAVTGILTGLFSSIFLVLISPNLMDPEDALFPLGNPAIVSVPLGFIGAWLGTVFSVNRRRNRNLRSSMSSPRPGMGPE